jgi:phosphate:Na+ symporter
MLLLFLADWASGMSYIPAAIHQAGLSPSAQLAAVYVLLHIASDLSMRLAHHPVERLIERHAPPSDEETLGRPRYLYDEALAEPESALLLVDKEQQRLLTSLPDYLASLREDVIEASPAAEVLHPAERNILRQCGQFLTDLADRNNSREVLERTIVLRDRNELLGSLQESLIELITVANSNSHAGEVRTLINNLVESLHMMLETLADVAKQPDADDLDMLRILTHDRSELMDSIRRRMQGSEIAVAAEVQQSVFSATALFERCTWLLRRYVLLLDAPIRQEAVSA